VARSTRSRFDGYKGIGDVQIRRCLNISVNLSSFLLVVNLCRMARLIARWVRRASISIPTRLVW